MTIAVSFVGGVQEDAAAAPKDHPFLNERYSIHKIVSWVSKQHKR